MHGADVPKLSWIAGWAFRPAAAGRLGLIEQRLQFLHDLRALEVKVPRLAGVGFDVVKLARRAGCGVGEDERLELGIVLVAVAAGAWVVEVFPVATADGESARPAKCLLEQVGSDGSAGLAEDCGQQVEAVLGGILGEVIWDSRMISFIRMDYLSV